MGVLGVLTAGGDCPGLNAVIRGVVGRATERGTDVVGILDGWEGLLHDRTIPLDRNAVRGILGRGGTFLGTSRLDPYVHAEGLVSCSPTIERNGIDRLVIIGGDGTLRAAMRLSDEGMPVVGVPKTIDNDIEGTDITFGFSTAVQIATDAIDRLATTAEAHNRVIVVETLRSRHRSGRRYSIVVVAEGIDPPSGQKEVATKKDAFGFDRLGGVGYRVASAIEERTGFETRVSVLGHIQRGGTPVAADRVLATRLGVAAADLAVDGETSVMTSVRGPRIEPIPLSIATAGIRGVPGDLYATAATFFG